MFSYKEAREYTKKNITGKSGKIFGYFLLYCIFKTIIISLLDSIDGIPGVLVSTVLAAIVTPIHVGLFRIIINIMNNKQVSVGMLFDDYKYFAKLFVIGLAFNLIINLGYKVYIVGLIFDYIYIGVLYYFIYNSNLSLSEFFNKIFDKIKTYFSEAVILELSYQWPLFVAPAIYILVMTLFSIIFAFSNLEEILSILETGDLLALGSIIIPILIITIIFVIILIILAVSILPRLLLAEAKFYSAFGLEEKKEMLKSDKKFCSNCGSKVEGEFCSNCGTKI